MPNAVAVELEGEPLTCGQLDEWSGRLARHLVDLETGREVQVGVCLERSPELVVACSPC